MNNKILKYSLIPKYEIQSKQGRMLFSKKKNLSLLII